MKTLHKLNDLVYVKVIARPSKVCKTPYVADIELEDGLLWIMRKRLLCLCLAYKV